MWFWEDRLALPGALSDGFQLDLVPSDTGGPFPGAEMASR